MNLEPKDGNSPSFLILHPQPCDCPFCGAERNRRHDENPPSLAPRDHDDCGKLKCEKPSGTPRTDERCVYNYNSDAEYEYWAVVFGGSAVPSDFARQLERELNEVRELAKAADEISSHQISTIAKERDELLEWKRGQKGIEDYYACKEELHKWRSCAEKLASHISPHSDECRVNYYSLVNPLRGTSVCNCDQGIAIKEFERLKGNNEQR